MILLKYCQYFSSLPQANTFYIVCICCTPRFTGSGGGYSNQISTTSATSGAGCAFPTGVPEFTSEFSWFVLLNLFFSAMLCFVHFNFFLYLRTLITPVGVFIFSFYTYKYLDSIEMFKLLCYIKSRLSNETSCSSSVKSIFNYSAYAFKADSCSIEY